MRKEDIDQHVLRSVVGDVIFERGRRYALEGRVHLLDHDSVGVAAVVSGTSEYDVQIETGARGIAATCSCPFAAEGFFCKHGVAVVLTWLRAEDGAPRSKEVRRVPSAGEEAGDEDSADSGPADEELLRETLAQKPLGELVDLLIGAAQRDGLLRARILVQAGVAPEVGFDQDELRRALVDAFSTEHFIGFREAGDYFWGIEEVLGEIDELVDAGFPGPAAELCLFALDLVEEFGSDVDDSAGGLAVVVEQVEETHLRASRAAEAEPEALAAELVGRALDSDYEIFYGAAERYATILGEQGLAAYRDLVEERWRALPSRTERFDDARSTLAALREQVAEVIGGADALLEVLEDSAEGVGGILAIAKVLHGEGRDAEALERLERGMEEHPAEQRLRALAASIHGDAGRAERAGELLWQNFAEHPRLSTYRELCTGAGEHFPLWRNDALSLLTTDADAATVRARGWSDAVAALLWEGAADEAWTVAHEGGCHSQLWLQLARARAEEHPGDALPIMLREAEQILQEGKRPAYQQGAALLREARSLAERTDGLPEFDEQIRALRERNRRRPALQEELTRAGLPT
jgi:uncharacterized Zn finger protein